LSETRSRDLVNSQLLKAKSPWRMVEYDYVSASFRKNGDERIVRLPYDALMACASVVKELDEVLEIIDSASRR